MKKIHEKENVIIIGGGIVGVMIAKFLSEFQHKFAVTVVDSGLIGSGASSISVGAHFPTGSVEKTRNMSTFSEQYYIELKNKCPSIPIRPIDLYACCLENDVSEFEQRLINRVSLGTHKPNLDFLVDWPDDRKYWHLPGSNISDVSGLCRSLIFSILDRVKVLEGVQVTDLKLRSDDVKLKVSTGETLTAARVILAPGPWVGSNVWADFTQDLGVRTKKIVAFHLDDLKPTAKAAVLFPKEDAFILRSINGYWIFSYTCQEWDVVPDRHVLKVTKRNISEATEVLQTCIGENSIKLRSGRAFCDSYTKTGCPVVSRVSGSGRLFYAGGSSGSGYRLAPAIAENVSKLVLGEYEKESS